MVEGLPPLWFNSPLACLTSFLLVFSLEVMSGIMWWLDSPFVLLLYIFALDFICEIAIPDWTNWTRYIVYMMGLYIAAR